MRLLALAAVAIPLGLGTTLPVPEANPITPEKIELGRRLFADTRLSKDGTIACTSCHDPERAFTKPDAVSPGVFGRKGRRNSPTILNRAWGRVFFWDGRAATLEQQVLMPIQDPNEMDLTLEEASQRVELPVDKIAAALATYVRAQMSGDTRYDRFNNGERSALSAQERNGLRVFQGRGNCLMCHVGTNFTDEKLHNTGIAWVPASSEAGASGRFVDDGAFEVTGKPEDRGAFKTPTLREVGRTAPYMHDGSLATLEEVVDYYDRGGRPNPNLDRDMQRLDLPDEDKRDLVAFLRTLSSAR
ncbi:MAG: cytochrome c peroxidase [Vicinamibacterales bacterium]